MYDDRNDEEGSSSSYGYKNNRKDFVRSPPRGPAVAGRYQLPPHDRGRREARNGDSREFERSRSPRRDARYTDRDREDYQSPQRDGSRSRSPYFGAPPNRNVILEGLPLDFTQEDKWAILASFLVSQIFAELQHDKNITGLDEVRVIKDKRTGQSRGFAFVQFIGIPEARKFLEDYYPAVYLYGTQESNQDPSIKPAKVRIAYSRERDDREKAGKGDDDWKCDVCYLPNFSHRTLCFRCNAPRTRSTVQGIVMAQSSMPGFITTGDSDVSPDGTASQFLLFRGLEPGVTEELLAKGVSKLIKVKSGTPPTNQSIARKSKISSTSNDASFGAREGSMRRVLLVRDRKTNDSWRYGFAEFSTVEDAQAAMVKFRSLDKFTIASKPVIVAYIHAGVFVPLIQPPKDEEPKFTFSPYSNTSTKLMYWDEAAYASELVTAVIEHTEPRVKELNNAKSGSIIDQEGLVSLSKDSEPRSKKRKVEKENKIVAPHLQFWTNRHAELHGIPIKTKEPEEDINDVSTQGTRTASPKQKVPRSFADLEAKCCQLCRRQFKTEDEVHKHERRSKLHEENLKNQTLVSKALAKLGNSNSDNSSLYRDRAKERRRAFNQPKQPVLPPNRTSVVTTKETEDPAPIQSKGAALLGKMGWTAGEGLGALGTGRTEAISTDLYAKGVGLGAKGGKIGDAAEEAHRQTKGSYADFLSKTKEKVKERFESLS
ncbi:unnamed protein product [Blumeria hordei]|uniref:RNA-binding protein n=1 Tax=Blumeria hordei TaxID=2867405 RepID=A0A383UZT5_BLUHO|nr:unnamed protein product [Blumeria hordei]